MQNPELIQRPFYRKKYTPFLNKNVVKVITGQRRVGKSYILLQIIKDVKKKYSGATLVYINKENEEFDIIFDYKSLISYIEKKIKNEKPPFFLFIDEIQEIDHFEKAIRHYHYNKQFDIYISGSNADMLCPML